MPHADPERRAAYNRERWRTHGRLYRAQAASAAPLPPISRRELLLEDLAQARALAELEARRIGRARALERLEAWVKAERAWIARCSSYQIGGLDNGT